MIRAIIFDYGNVIETIDDSRFLRKISNHTDKSVEELNELIYNSDLPGKYENGLISSELFYNEIVERCNLAISIQDFINAYTNVGTPIRTTIDLMKKLKRKYKIALISNTSEWDYKWIVVPSQVYELFDAVTVSFMIKAMKPEKKIYYDALKKLDLKPGECVYIDDVKKYVDGACKIGIKGILYTSHDGLLKSLRDYGVKWYE